jgi:hypothetical protein
VKAIAVSGGVHIWLVVSSGRNPAKKYIPRSGQNQDVAPLTRGFVIQLDSGLMKLLAIRLSWQKTPAKSLVMRRNDELRRLGKAKRAQRETMMLGTLRFAQPTKT